MTAGARILPFVIPRQAPRDPALADWSQQAKRWPNFPRHEMECHCGCGRADMTAEFMDYLQWLRWSVGRPLVIASGFRCPWHNSQVSSSGSRDGPHTRGVAADPRAAYELAELLLQLLHTPSPAGILADGRGINQRGDPRLRFIHVDLAGLRRCWSY